MSEYEMRICDTCASFGPQIDHGQDIECGDDGACHFNPAMLLIDTTVLSVIQMTITAVSGMFGVAAGMEGYCFAQMNIVIRLVEVCGGLMLIHPSLITDLCGLALVIGGLAFQYMLGRKK